MISVRHPIKARIEDQSSFLFILLEKFPFLIDEWEKRCLDDFRKTSKDISNEDTEIGIDCYNQMVESLGDKENECNIFYQSMLIMVCSYYESILIRILKEESLKNIKPTEIIKKLREVKNIRLSEECLEKMKYLDDYIRPLRNQLCHNNNGTPKNVEILKKIAKTNDNVNFEDGEIRITQKDIVVKSLDMAYYILSELSEKLGYKTQRI